MKARPAWLQRLSQNALRLVLLLLLCTAALQIVFVARIALMNLVAAASRSFVSSSASDRTRRKSTIVVSR